MKTIVLSAIFAAATSMNVCANNQFAYNQKTTDQNQVTTETVYKKNGNYLEHHLQYDFEYDEQGRIVRKEAFRWNEFEEAYQRYYCIEYNYNDAQGISMEYALWDKQTGSYSANREKAVYNPTQWGLNYQCYEWDEHRMNWELLAYHQLDNGTTLLAER